MWSPEVNPPYSSEIFKLTSEKMVSIIFIHNICWFCSLHTFFLVQEGTDTITTTTICGFALSLFDLHSISNLYKNAPKTRRSEHEYSAENMWKLGSVNRVLNKLIMLKVQHRSQLTVFEGFNWIETDVSGIL